MSDFAAGRVGVTEGDVEGEGDGGSNTTVGRCGSGIVKFASCAPDVYPSETTISGVFANAATTCVENTAVTAAVKTTCVTPMALALPEAAMIRGLVAATNAGMVKVTE